MIQRRALLAFVALTALRPAAALAAGHGKDKDRPAGPYIELPTLTAAAIGPDGRRGVLTVQAGLYTTRPALQARITLSMPLLMNAYVPAMQAWAYRLPPGRAPDVDGLALALQRATDGVVGPGARLLLGGVMVN